jgi:hypothetical protein
VLSPLQERVAAIVAGLDEAKDFALAGGAALILRGEVERRTRDLDFFGLTGDAVDADARLFPAEPARPAPTLRGEELAVDKVLAIFGRAEARDFVDLMALEPLYGLDRLCQLAAEKDPGFTPTVFAEMLGQFQRLRRDEFELDEARYEQLASDTERWRERVLELTRSRELRHERDVERGPEL